MYTVIAPNRGLMATAGPLARNAVLVRGRRSA